MRASLAIRPSWPNHPMERTAHSVSFWGYSWRFSCGPPLTGSVCARHGTELTGWKSPCQVSAEPKARRRARAFIARWRLEEAQSKRAGRRTGTGYEVWYTRDEWARDHKVLHPRVGCAL